MEELQTDLDEWILWYNKERTHSGKYCFGKTPQQTFEESKKLSVEKILNEVYRIANSLSDKSKLSD